MFQGAIERISRIRLVVTTVIMMILMEPMYVYAADGINLTVDGRLTFIMKLLRGLFLGIGCIGVIFLFIGIKQYIHFKKDTDDIDHNNGHISIIGGLALIVIAIVVYIGLNYLEQYFLSIA